MFVNAKTVIDNVMTMIQSSPVAIRPKMLIWLNTILKRLAVFPWECLEKSGDLAIVANAITLPGDFYDVSDVLVGGIYLTFDDEVSVRSAHLWAKGGTRPIGYLRRGGKLTLVPGTSEATATLTYIQEVPNCLDTADATLFPVKFQPLLERTLLNTYYENDADPRGGQNVPFDSELLAALIASEVRNDDIGKKYARFLKALSAVQSA